MLKTALATISRFQVFSILLLAMVFTAPAFESHACPAPGADLAVAAEMTASSTSADVCPGCPDCGPACAGGCCHAPHSAMASDPPVHRSPVAFARPSAWTHVVRAPVSRPTGPERPPRT